MLADITTTNPGNSKVGTYNYEYDANKNKTRERIEDAGLAINLYGFSTGPYDAEDRLVAWNRDNQTLNQSWNLSLVGDFDDVTTNNGQPVIWAHN